MNRGLGFLLAVALPFFAARAAEDEIGQQTATADDTTALVNQIIEGYLAHLNQLSANSSDETRPAVPANGDASETQPVSTPTPAPRASQSALRTSHLQTSGGLESPHLSGYPALPDSGPASSVHFLTEEQLKYKARLDEQIRIRKEFLKTHPRTE